MHASTDPLTGVIYLLHFTRAYKHARHYIGWTPDLAQRLACHRQGHGARLIAVIIAAGIDFQLARTTLGTRTDERTIKHAGGATRYCPLCVPRPWTGHWLTTRPAPSPNLPAPDPWGTS